MPEQIHKLSPHRDLQCYFRTPSAIASISRAFENGFTISGAWREQFDWAVVEWTRDNVYEHPALRYLPDGDLSDIQLNYSEQRTSCVPLESNLFATVDWPYLRIWATGPDGIEHVYFVPLLLHATAAASGRYESASGALCLTGSPTVGDRVGVAMPVAPANSGYPEQHYYYNVRTGDNLASIAAGLADVINVSSPDFTATSQGTAIYLVWNGSEISAGMTGANGNRITIYGFTNGGATEKWLVDSVTLAGGLFPSTYSVSLNFTNLMGYKDQAGTDTATMVSIPTGNVRKMRWTWAADLQPASFTRTEFQVLVSDWYVTGSNLQWSVAGPGSRRIEDNDPTVKYAGSWSLQGHGNYSGNTINLTQEYGSTATFCYSEGSAHNLFVGTRLVPGGANLVVSIDGEHRKPFSLAMPSEDVLVRLPLGSVSAGPHTVVIKHDGPDSDTTYSLFVDFLEICYPSSYLPDFSRQPLLSLATDYDTYHSQALPAERTAWMIQKLGFTGRANHYMGALWFYDLVVPGHVYNSVTITFTLPGTEVYGYTELVVGPPSLPLDRRTVIRHYNLPDDGVTTVSLGLADVINQGYTAIWASVQDNVLTITNRAMTAKVADPSNTLAISVTPGTGCFTATLSNDVLAGGSAGVPYDDPVTDAQLYPITLYWRTDVTGGINRAARDWARAFFAALRGYGLDAVAAFSTEMKNADPGVDAGLAQRRSDGSPVILNTPAVQTNFSTESIDFWKQVYLDMATLQVDAGLTPYLQFGEVQWWYYPWNVQGDSPVSMPFYDSYTQQQFIASFGTAMSQILTNDIDPAQYPREASFLSTLIGSYTSNIRAAVQGVYPNARFEALYPTDTNATAFNQLINYPADWTVSNLASLKTESFTYTYARNLDASLMSMRSSASKGFPNGARSHLVGIGDATSAWPKEVDLAQAQGMESVVLFALDQYCLIGYPLPPFVQQARSLRVA